MPDADFTIDNLPAEPFNRTGNVIVQDFNATTSHTRLYQSSTLTPGLHTLTMTIAEPSKVGARFIVDFLTVGAGADVSSGYVIVDDSDPRVVYSGDWVPTGVPDEYLTTTHASPVTTSGNDNGGASFSFYGGSFRLISRISSAHSFLNAASPLLSIRDWRDRLRHSGSPNAQP